MGMNRSIICGLLTVLLLYPVSSPVFSKGVTNKEEALKQAFPGATAIERQDVFLEDAELKRIEALSKSKLESKLFTFYRGENNGTVLGYAFIGTRVIRTKPAVYLVLIRPDGSIERLSILAFHEPEEYLPADRWFTRFSNRVLDDELWPKKGIDAVTGATMSVNGLTQEARMILAVFGVMIKDKAPLTTK